MNKTICYCFQYTTADIIKDVQANQGRSLILEKVIANKQQGRCRCQNEHPEGR